VVVADKYSIDIGQIAYFTGGRCEALRSYPAVALLEYGVKYSTKTRWKFNETACMAQPGCAKGVSSARL
jgi:hypothetical protein